MLNIPTQSFPASSSQQRVSPSGQSGRNKVALKPGHSLMDWVRFAKSAKDLTGLKGRLIEVTQEELQKHNTRKDCWTCIRGLVYNVTPYMDYHPGGEEELMKAAGIDGTDIFDQIHRWVNYESMLKECLVGRMATKNTAAVKAIVLLPPPTGLAPPAAVAAAPNSDSQPWYDWFQTDTTVHLIIYAKRKIHSSGCMSVDLQAGVLRVEALLGKKSYMIHICLADQVEENIAVQTTSSVGKIQVTMHKQNKEKWKSLGQPLELHNTFLCKKDRDTEMVRPYTPVNQTLAAASHQPAQESDLYLMIKVYPDGVFTPYLNNLQIGGHISVSGPEGTFSLRPLCDTTDLYLLAAGTGFTPMARLIHLALQEVDTIRQTKLLFFNQRQEDILWYSQLDDLATKDRRFKVEYILSEPSDNWMGRTGRVDKAVLNELLIRPDGSRCYVCVCGPSAFTELTIRLLKELGFGEDELHAFQG
ncbi:cytochrome b5 reductase 4 isoform X2 [Kryptolebias marmoratus]|uniref:cytochrome b5 reductase 4 isoform X2 n=1 Tax=Kryptolebias marmoratus TaxID=37003 RepID=UPI0007F876A6|nr:cytochrome b5 reductase 4 isoform X2 [Kryptolebias marmoratus]